MRLTIITAFFSLLCAGAASAGGEQNQTTGLSDGRDRVSYSLGLQIGRDFRKEKMDLDADAFLSGVKDALSRKEPAVDRESMSETLLDMKKRLTTRQRAEKVEMVERRLGGGNRFLEENSRREGVTSLASGLQYEVRREGTGKRPQSTDRVKVHYRGSLIDGTVFRSSYRKGRPEVFHVSGVLRGITEALQLMREGAEWQVVLPPELAFSRRSELGYRSVIYDLELISIESKGDQQDQ
jgi:FKBP-type peptidyl-prolyl cis-trans isomerase FklB